MISVYSETASPSLGKPRRDMLAISGTAFNAAATAWFAVAVIGQLLFALYIVSFYWGHALQGNMPAWNKILPTGHVPGDRVGNAVLAIHVMMTAIVTIGGPLQMIPIMRASFPVFHQWNGRLYVITVVVASLAGLFAVWTHSANGSFLQHLTISANAVLILIAAWFTLRYALARQLAEHRRWALRLFLLVSGSWFFRVMLMFWIAVNGGPAGFDPKTFQGPALVTIGMLQFLLPLAVLELYFLAKNSVIPTTRFATAGLVCGLTVAMAVGISVATLGIWWPNIG